MRNLVFRAEPNDAASCAPADANALPPCPGHADIVFAIRNGFLKRWTVAVASTGGRQLGAKTHGDYELTITDLNYSGLTDFSEMEFVMPDPGAKDGIRKCFRDNRSCPQHG
jgi:hypothetical protein